MPRLKMQVMYAYVMRPETLPKSYWKFIVKSGPIETPALEAVRRSLRKLPIDLQAFNAFIKKRGGTAFLTTAFPKQVSTALPLCSVGTAPSIIQCSSILCCLAVL